MNAITPFPASHWTSLGYSQEHTVAMTQLNTALAEGTSELNDYLGQTAAENATNADIVIGIEADAAYALPEGEGSLLPDASLLPLWKEFAAALGALATNEKVLLGLEIYNIQLSTEVLSILEPALKAAPIEKFLLSNNILGIDGINFVTSVLEANHSLSKLYLWGNEIVGNEIFCGPEALLLVEAAREHPVLDLFGLQYWGTGHILPFVPEIFPALLSLNAVDLEGNFLRSHAASLISDCLATNPSIKGLNLDGNLFNDDDARLFAKSLGTNTNLNVLNLRNNNFTDAGFKTLHKSVYDDQSPNTIYGSNHTCELRLFDEGAHVPNGVDEAVLTMNGIGFERNIFPDSVLLRYERTAGNGGIFGFDKLLQIEGRKKIKMLHAIQGGNSGHIKMQWIENVPVELMPEVFVFLQESGKYAVTEETSYDRLFQVIRARQEVTAFHSDPYEERSIQRQYKKRRTSCHKSN